MRAVPRPGERQRSRLALTDVPSSHPFSRTSRKTTLFRNAFGGPGKTVIRDNLEPVQWRRGRPGGSTPGLASLLRFSPRS